jgi:hypothetical protein
MLAVGAVVAGALRRSAPRGRTGGERVGDGTADGDASSRPHDENDVEVAEDPGAPRNKNP